MVVVGSFVVSMHSWWGAGHMAAVAIDRPVRFSPLLLHPYKHMISDGLLHALCPYARCVCALPSLANTAFSIDDPVFAAFRAAPNRYQVSAVC